MTPDEPTSPSDTASPFTRRDFIKASSVAAGAVAFPYILKAQPGGLPPSERLNIAIVGVGGQGGEAVRSMKDENVVALCDVDDEHSGNSLKRYGDQNPEHMERLNRAQRFKDYRQMFDKMGNEIDAVTVSTPDHSHYPIPLAALSLGKHVFCQKPLTHSVSEARELTRIARSKPKLVTQMGNQGHTHDGTRLLREWVQSGVLGEIREVHSWTNRPVWDRAKALPDHSKLIPVVPSTLNWDGWLCGAANRPYDPAYLPWKWRAWWDFGTGALGDVGCHIMDGAFWALDLGSPTWVEAMSSPVSAFGAPATAIITYHFPARGKMPAVKYTWSDGGVMPKLPDGFEPGRALNEEAGTLLYGSKATALRRSDE